MRQSQQKTLSQSRSLYSASSRGSYQGASTASLFDTSSLYPDGGIDRGKLARAYL